MSGLNDYLAAKKQAIDKREEERRQSSPVPSEVLTARVRAKDRSGIREIRIRNYQIISDSPPDYAGYDLGPSSPELQLGVLGSCLTHITLIQAAIRGVRLDSLEVEVEGDQHKYGGKPGYEEIPFWPHNLRYTLHIESPASEEEITELYGAVEKVCPILNLLANPQTITGRILHTAGSGQAKEITV
ncbi:OsmC family protein [Paenibacillus sp. FJAT-26967]|uniref:OsmC family protein n=1 Tax=Paenibacillus sp. FJAT-26967 TaxID=1729690 RepID=UPI0008384746|nr:OsmC family protein [Paenibacillus sp. FJAT-26967]